MEGYFTNQHIVSTVASVRSNVQQVPYRYYLNQQLTLKNAFTVRNACYSILMDVFLHTLFPRPAFKVVNKSQII